VSVHLKQLCSEDINVPILKKHLRLSTLPPTQISLWLEHRGLLLLGLGKDLHTAALCGTRLLVRKFKRENAVSIV
jgi:hypothetical protein